MNDQVPAIKCLDIDDVKIYDAKGEKISLLTKGKLEVLYVAEHDRFVLRINSFKYILSTHLPIMASLFEEQAFRSYVLPTMNGHYVVKLKSPPTPATVRNFETVLSTYSQFSYQQSHEHDLENQAHRKGENQMAYEAIIGTVPEPTEDVLHADNNNLAKASKYFKIGGDMLRQNFLKAATYIGKNLRHPKDTPPALGPNQLSVRTIDELRTLENTENQSVALPKYEIHALVTLCHEIEKNILSQTDQEKGVKMQPSDCHRWPMFKKTAIESAHTLWKGMDDALTTLSKTVKNKRPKGAAPPLDQKFMNANNEADTKKENQMPQPMQQGDHHHHSAGQKQGVGSYLKQKFQLGNGKGKYPDISNTTHESAGSQAFEQKNVSRFPNIRGEVKGKANDIANPLFERQGQYAGATQAWRNTNDYSYT